MASLARPLARCLRRVAKTPRIYVPALIPSRNSQVASAAIMQDQHAHQQPPVAPQPQPQDQTQAHALLQSKAESLIAQLPLVQSLRSNPSYQESRPHLSMNASVRPTHFVAGSLAGPGMVTVPPYMWARTEEDAASGKQATRIVSVFHVGKQLCGHPGFVHGGLLSVMFDEAFARCVSASFASGSGMTANLNVDFRKPAAPDRVYVLRAETVRVDGRKAWVEGELCSLAGRGEAEGEVVKVAEAKALFVEPKFAESMVSVYRN